MVTAIWIVLAFITGTAAGVMLTAGVMLALAVNKTPTPAPDQLDREGVQL